MPIPKPLKFNGPSMVIRSLLAQLLRRKTGDGLEQVIGHVFKKPELLAHALIHRSWVPGKDLEHWQTNERLEFLGDSVLNMLVTDYLYHRYPESTEGDLSKHKSIIVSGRALAESARLLNLGEYLRIGKGEIKAGGRDKDSILADAFEAVLGSVYLDGGIEPCRRMLEKVHFPRIARILSDTLFVNYKSLLLETLQGRNMAVPEYRMAEESGPEHSKRFVMDVLVDGVVRGSGDGFSKKKAEQNAAREALQSLLQDPTRP